MGQRYSDLRRPSATASVLHEAIAQPCVKVKTEPYYCVGAEGAQPSSFAKFEIREGAKLAEGERLCAVCLSLGQLSSSLWISINDCRDVVLEHHSCITELIRSALGGCHFCCLLLIVWEQNCRLVQESDGQWVGKLGFESAILDDRIRLKFQREKKILRYTDVEIDEVQISILCGDMPPEMGGQLVCYPSSAEFESFPENCLPSEDDTNTGSEASMSRIKAWLDICSSSHPACKPKEDLLPPLPARVMDVGRKSSDTCYLVSGNEKRGNYATLSHCWGSTGNRPLTTTEKTLVERQSGIKDEEMPKTFRNAIQVCRDLGIEYIWIDSLCIIQEQDSLEDWSEEAPKMGDVYGNSVLTIAAAVAADSTEGCFQDRFGLSLWPCPIVLFGKQCHVSRHPTMDEERGGDLGDIDMGPKQPLNDRAWVLQEQVLSPRTLIFARKRLVWRCASLTTNEKYPLGMPHAPSISADNHRLLHCIINDMVDMKPGDTSIDPYTCWYRMVMAVTSRKLTFNDDKLAAVAGIAKRFATTTNDSYHAGMWRGGLIVGLLWHSTTMTPTKSNRAGRAPSWSWASVNCGVSYLGLLSARCDAVPLPLSPLISIVSVVDPPTCAEHPFGMTSQALLHLSGALLPVARGEHEDSGLFLMEHGTRYANDIENFSPDDYGLEPTVETPWYCLPVCVRHDPYDRGMRVDPEPYKNSWRKSLETGVDEFGKYNKVFCLVLQAVNGQQNTFRRVGVAVISSKKGTDISIISLGQQRELIII